MDPVPLENAGGLVVCAVLGCLVVAIANGANDIANSMGTSFGAGALTLRQAIVYGAAAEFAGAVLLGSSVAKTISKGVINPDEYAADGCEGVLTFAVGMISVLAGTGSTTLLATLYGLPISASHGVIGGLLAVGLVSHGSAGIGWAPLEQTVVAWVASPLLGGITAGALNFVVITAVHRTRAPARRAQLLQPLFVAITVAVAVAFILITGPSAVKVRPVALAVLISCAAGMAVGLGSIALGPTARLDQLLRTMRRSETEMETEIEAEVEDEPETAPEAIPMPASVMPSPPPVAARAVDPMDAAFDGGVERIPLTRANAIMDLPTPPRIPRMPATQAPSLPHLAAANDALDSPDQSMFWPWPQQDEWSDRDVVMKIKDAMEAAKRKDVAQATVIIDEVGPHLGSRTKLLYPIGALLQRIGRAATVDKMMKAALAAEPDDKHIQTAQSKLRP